ncbi:hypothetical protein OJF2_44630 [Aquisphaera giovannonii]|uniref:Uncharacterized protein n=1 Tax=Aquisphaera giovannonii TaxID=406548 RepID=A0A5B9W5G2_9BACT|nr:hypothetical protein [Aquisphaera giovannonii]QEH35906.1 hypothetical protein OJF2_44630 [Aquisphaera giovannonii]
MWRVVVVIAGVICGGSLGQNIVAAQPAPSTEEQFYDLVFGEGVVDTTLTPNLAREKLVSILKSTIILIDVNCGLNEEQQFKLRIAGEIQIEHLLDQVDEKRRVFLAVKGDPVRVKHLLAEIRPLQDAWITNPFLKGSLFWKALRKALPESQAMKAEALFEQLLSNEWQETIETFVEIEGEALGLDDTHRSRLQAVLTKQTRPSNKLVPYRLGDLLSQVSRMPETTFTSVLEKKQWQALKTELDFVANQPPRIQGRVFRASHERPRGQMRPAAQFRGN